MVLFTAVDAANLTGCLTVQTFSYGNFSRKLLNLFLIACSKATPRTAIII